jgi:hypothetical protein
MSASTSPRRKVTRLAYAPRGAALDLFYRREAEVMVSGPAGTGKSRACLERLHLVAQKYPGMRALIARKTRASLTQTGMVTYERKVLHPLDGVQWRTSEQEYRYPNGSVVVVGGLDKPSKIMSTEFDLIYVQEATELLENDWESLTTRLRNGVVPYQQLFGDCNPDSAIHWLKLRADAAKTAMLESRHEDNPTLWDAARGAWTVAGRAYIAILDALTGVRHLRLRKGIWASAEGLVYDGWDRALHLIDRVPAPDGAKLDAAGVPVEWPRYLVIDFGYTNPFVAQWWAEDPDGRLYRYREIYRTQRLVEDHAREIRRLGEGEPAPRDVVTDHDAEDRATLERHLGYGTLAAHKAVSPGIQATAARLKPAGDGRPRLFLVRDALVEADPVLIEKKLPACTEQEVEAYVWDVAHGRKKGEEPVKKDDHGMDALRYLVAHRDLVGDVTYGPSIWS